MSKNTCSYLSRYNRWLESPKVDLASKAELYAISGNDKEIRERFSNSLEFGTAGLRGTMVAGINAMNLYTVGQATQGFASYIRSTGEENCKRGIIIGYDSRLCGAVFSQKAAAVMAYNGIKVYLFDSLRPTPELSFAVRELNCIAGINITASHNPKQYNGYKAYWEDGAQLSPEQADAVSAYIAATDIFDDVPIYTYEQAINDGMVTVIGKAFDEKYIAAVMAQRVNPEIFQKAADSLKVVYTPLYGAGLNIVPEVLKRCGLKQLYTVDCQLTADGSFPTTPKPNPEYPQVFELGIELAERIQSDLIVANDPDCDRTGIMVKGSDGKFTGLTGNQVGALLLDYIITAYKETGTMPDEPYAVKTIVTSELITKICETNNVKLHNVLTGFKFIGEVIKKHEEAGRGSYIFGFEESYGYLKGSYARDKDGVVASMLICEMAAYYQTKGMTLAQAMGALYEKYGSQYLEATENIEMKGLDGLQKMARLMDSLRDTPPKTIGGQEITEIRDYKTQTITDLKTGSVSSTGLPPSNVLYYKTANDNVIVIRPSGTEPKVKIYFLLHGKDKNSLALLLKECQQTAQSWV